MSTNFPSGTDVLTNPIGTQTLDTPDHAAQHGNANDAIEAIESNVGTNSGTNIFKNFVAGNFPVRNTGGGATGTLVQTIIGGTIGTTLVNNSTFGTPTITVGGDTVGDMYYRSAGGTLDRIPTGGSTSYLSTNGGTPTWSAPFNVSSPAGGTTATGTTASASLVDVVGGSVTITPTRTVKVFAQSSGRVYGNAAANISPSLMVNGTTMQTYDVGVTAGQVGQGIPYSISGMATVGTGAIIIKLQYKTSAGTMSIEPNLMVLWG